MVRTCSFCGVTAGTPDDSTPLGWSVAVDDGRTRYLCTECARANIRAIEGKLPEEYWR